MAAPQNNKNAEKWTYKEAKDFMEKAVSLSYSKEYDYIGEVAKDLKTYHEVFDYLSNKFKDLKRLKNLIISNCEVNCFSNAKKGDIVASVAIMNLKSNHKWTDRNQTDLNVNTLPTLKVEYVTPDEAE